MNPYDCYEIVGSYATSTLAVTANIFTSDHTLTSTVKTGSTAVPSSDISIGVSQVAINLNTSLVTANKIYEVYAGYVINLRGGSVFTKNAFFNTFKLSTQQTSDDLTMPRSPHCF